MLQQLMLQADGYVRLVDVEEPTPLPEFAFSPRKGEKHLSRQALCITCTYPISEKPGQRHHFYITQADGTETGPHCPNCAGYTPDEFEPRILNTPRSIRAENTPGKADPDWDVAIQSKPRFASIPLARSNRAPLGTAKPFIPASFTTREAEYNFLVATQDLELATSEQELRETGFDAFRLNVATDGIEPEISDEERERAACRYGTAYEQPDPDLIRRIEWERWVSQCGATLRITLEDGHVAIHDERLNPYPKYPISEERRAKILAKRAQIEAMVRERLADVDIDEALSARDHVRHFRLRVLDYMTPEERDAWFNGDAKTRYLAEHDFLVESNEAEIMALPKGEAILPDPEDPAGQQVVTFDPDAEPVHGPQEIGFHGMTLPMDFRSELDYRAHVTHDDRESEEPSEFALWQN